MTGTACLEVGNVAEEQAVQADEGGHGHDKDELLQHCSLNAAD